MSNDKEATVDQETDNNQTEQWEDESDGLLIVLNFVNKSNKRVFKKEVGN